MERNCFDVELSRFKDERVAISAAMVLEMLPDYFFTIPASSSGRYHPSFSLGEGGLVRHVKVAMRILEEMFRDEAFGVYDDYKKDLIRMALLLHDGFKSGLEYSGHTAKEHPVIMADFIIEKQPELFISEEDAQFVASLIRSHMGPWNTDYQGMEILPKPKTKYENFVHMCDYLASRKYLDIKFDNNDNIIE